MLVMRRDYVEFVFLVVVNLVFFAPARSLDTAVTLTSPAPFQVFQRTNDSGAIVIQGHVENGGQYTVSALWGNQSSGVLYQGIASDFTALWEGLPVGQHDLIVSAGDVSITVPNVGIGDVYVIAGQSNAVGHGVHYQMYIDSTNLRAGMLTAHGWQELQDPVGTVADFRARGSQWPILATYILATHTPVAFIPVALSGTSVKAWQPGQVLYENMTDLLDQLHAPYARAVLWQQGERDLGMSAKDYTRYLAAIADALYADYGLAFFPAHIYQSDQINAGMDEVVEAREYVYLGADLAYLKPDGVHYTSDKNLQVVAWRWWEALVNAGYYVIPG